MLPTEVIVVLALATYRATRLVTTDTITHAFRGWLYRWAWSDEDGSTVEVDGKTMFEPASRGSVRSYVYELLTCPWCLGVWAAAALYSLWRWVDVTPVRVTIVILAIAGVQGFLASRADA